MSIQSVERAIDILQAIANKRTALGLPELSEILGLPKTTIYTLVQTLKKKGMVLQDPSTKKYGLGFALFELGAIQVSELEMQKIALLAVEHLASDLNVECRLGVWHDQTVIVTQHAQPLGSGGRTKRIGPRLPAYCTALGKAILAFLPENELDEYLEQVDLVKYTERTITNVELLRDELLEIRKKKFAISDGELVPYRSSMGAPIFGAEEKVEGAISLSLDFPSSDMQHLESIAGKLLRATHEISLSLGYPALRKI